MNRKIAILRGINVGGKRRIRMSDLKSLCKKLGWKDVETYIQSGNIIFTSDNQNSNLEEALKLAIKEKYRFDVPVIVRNSKELQTSIGNNPFYNQNIEINQLHLTFLKEKPLQEKEAQILTQSYEPDKFKIMGKDVFILCAEKYHKSKLTTSFFERKLNTRATTRNWKTVLKLSELSKNKKTMKKDLIAVSNIKINATQKKVWKVLTAPNDIKKYLFGTKVETNWKVGNPIRFQGEYNRQQYTDKGNVIERKENELLKYDYWSGFSGLEDKPENYSLVTYKIEKLNDISVKLTWHQQGFSNEEGRQHTEESLKNTLKIIKELAERQN